MTCILFLGLVFAMGSMSIALNFFNGTTTTWDSPKRVAAHPELYKRNDTQNPTKDTQNYDPAKVINAMGKIDAGLTILTAHRGIYGPGCPENSKCSIAATVDAGIESVEIDVYSDKDGTLWPLHDRRIGRVTNYVPRHSTYFNPYHDAPSGINNPLLSDMGTQDLVDLSLRDINGNTTADYHFEKLEALLTYIKQLGVLAVVLDMRTKAEILTAVKLIQSLGMTDMVAIKCQVLVIPPLKSVIDGLEGIRFIPVQYPGPAEVIAQGSPPYNGNFDSIVTEYDLSYKNFDNFLYFEPSTKVFKLWHGFGWAASGPLGFVQWALNDEEVPLGAFVLTPNVPEGYFDTDGHCCGQPNDWLFNSSMFGDETRDDRGNSQVLLLLHAVVTCDNILPVLDLAKQYRYRDNLHKILK